MRALDGLLDPARHLALGAGDVERLVHGLVPRLLLGGDVDRRLGGLAAGAGVGVHDLAGAGRVVARRRIGRTLAGFVAAVVVLTGTVPVAFGLAFPVPVFTLRVRIVTVGVVVLSVVVIGGVGRIAGVVVVGIVRGLRCLGGIRAGGAGIGGRVAIITGVAVLGLEAVVGLLDGETVPGLRIGREREARVADERMGDELRGHLPALGVALAPARVVLQGAGHHHARHRGLDEVRIGLRHPPGRVADLVPVGRERLAAEIGPEREPQHEAPEEGLLAQQLRHAVADPKRGFGEYPARHQAAFRTGSGGGAK